MAATRELDDSFADRALPPGSAHHFAHLFAAPAARPALLGCFALVTEWQALLDPATPPDVRPIKIGWWQEEVVRLTQGSARHPVSLYLTSLPGARSELFQPLARAIEAVALESGGVPLEQAEDLAAHAMALIGIPLALAAQLAYPGRDLEAGAMGLPALAQAEYLARSLRDYRRAARTGRVPFAVADLLRAGIETPDLVAEQPSPALARYLHGLRRLAGNAFERSQVELAPMLRAPLRHHLVLSALGRARLERSRTSRLAPLQDMLTAWNAARRAAR